MSRHAERLNMSPARFPCVVRFLELHQSLRPDLPFITEQPSAFCDALRHRRVAFTTRPGKCGTHVDPGGCKGRSFIKASLILLSASGGGVACVRTCGRRLHASFAEPRSAWEHVRTSDSWGWSPTAPQTHGWMAAHHRTQMHAG